MPKIQNWTPEKAKKELYRRLQRCKESRVILEDRWNSNLDAVYGRSRSRAKISFDSMSELSELSNESRPEVNYVFKHMRLIHAQMSANPPTCIPRPGSTDADDERRADAADRLIRFALRQYKIQEKVDQVTLFTLCCGTGILKTVWNPNLGDIAEYDKETGEVIMEGDIEIRVVSPFDLSVDPDAKTVDDIRYTFERIYMPLEEALFRWPDKEDVLKKHMKDSVEERSRMGTTGTHVQEMCEVYEYYEKGQPYNGMLGRFAIILEDGEVLESPRPNPFSFSPKRGKDLPPTARLPYVFLTDIDVPESPYGKSFVEYESDIQDIINRLDYTTLDALKAHTVARLVLMEGSEIEKDSISNNSWDFVKVSGSVPPHFMAPMQLPADLYQFRDRFQSGGDDMAGVNESMYGQMSRETPASGMQYAANQGAMVRRRLFNKYVLFVEAVYNNFIDLVIKYWTEPRTIKVLGTEKAFEATELKGTDVNGGFDLWCEYGTSLSLDPTARREEIMMLQPLFEKAGVDANTMLRMMKLNELEGLYDINQLAADRQREIFEEMIATNRYIEPREMQEHKGMLTWAYRYIMTTGFKYLDEDKKVLIEQHIKAREQLAAGPAPTPALPGVAPDMPPLPGAEMQMGAPPAEGMAPPLPPM